MCCRQHREEGSTTKEDSTAAAHQLATSYHFTLFPTRRYPYPHLPTTHEHKHSPVYHQIPNPTSKAAKIKSSLWRLKEEQGRVDQGQASSWGGAGHNTRRGRQPNPAIDDRGHHMEELAVIVEDYNLEELIIPTYRSSNRSSTNSRLISQNHPKHLFLSA